jgi:hypothetical protein
VLNAEGFLQRVELLAGSEPFHRTDLCLMALHRQEETAAHRFAVQQDGAGPTDPMFASQMCAGEIEIFS